MWQSWLTSPWKSSFHHHHNHFCVTSVVQVCTGWTVSAFETSPPNLIRYPLPMQTQFNQFLHHTFIPGLPTSASISYSIRLKTSTRLNPINTIFIFTSFTHISQDTLDTGPVYFSFHFEWSSPSCWHWTNPSLCQSTTYFCFWCFFCSSTCINQVSQIT